MTSGDVDDVELKRRSSRLRLIRRNDSEIEALRNASERVVAGPQMPRRNSQRLAVRFCQASNRARHVAILAVLLAETGIVEVIPPLVKRLRLLADHPRAK